MKMLAFFSSIDQPNESIIEDAVRGKKEINSKLLFLAKKVLKKRKKRLAKTEIVTVQRPTSKDDAKEW